MGRYAERATCESCQSIDVRHWHREGRLRTGECFPLSSWYDMQLWGGISVRSQDNAVVLMFRGQNLPDREWVEIDQHIPIVWTNCALGGKRPWFLCTSHRRGRYCGRRVAKLYLRGGSIFACRHCYRLVFASQQESSRHRSISRARKIRMRLGGSANLVDRFPEKPPRMHWRIYRRLRERAVAAEASCNAWIMQRPLSLKRR
jgi:hypothetical protein